MIVQDLEVLEIDSMNVSNFKHVLVMITDLELDYTHILSIFIVISAFNEGLVFLMAKDKLFQTGLRFECKQSVDPDFLWIAQRYTNDLEFLSLFSLYLLRHNVVERLGLAIGRLNVILRI